MSVLLDELTYREIRNDDPSYQALTRVGDANNIYDIKQVYIKNKDRNDFAEPASTWSNNAGLLNDGKYINMLDFFMDTETITVDGKPFIKGITIPYFRFKTNAVLDYRNGARIAGTYIDKTKVESIYGFKDTITVDTSGDVSTVFGQDEKKLVENTYNSYPLQRVDKLIVYDLASLFLYVNGRKIPDNEVFIYTNKSFTDVFIPTKYLGDITSPTFETEVTINIDYRQAGSEDLYFRDNKHSGNRVVIDLKDEQYDYVDSINKPIDLDRIVMFINGNIVRAKSVNKSSDGVLTVTLDKIYESCDVELYILNNIVYRSNLDDSKQLNTAQNKLHFYLNDDYITDTLCGPITKSAISFFYDGKRIDDELITQTSRFSFEFNINIANYDPSKVDFFIEDINWRIDDLTYRTYGDDYYLLNMLGVQRCVDKMRGYKTYSVFDEDLYSGISFKKTLSDNGALFDVIRAENKYRNLDYQINSPTTRAKTLIKERPTLLRKLLEKYKVPSKRLVVIGNEEDVVVSSVTPIKDPKQEVYYKIYVNHALIPSSKYSTSREIDHDIITIDKSVLISSDDPDQLKKFQQSINEIEIIQYDMTYKNKAVYLENIKNGFEEIIDPDGERSYVKTYMIEDLPFDEGFTIDDLCAIERLERRWFDSNCKEYYYVYPSDEYIGYRLIKSFEITKKTDDLMTIKIRLHDYNPDHNNGAFFLMSKQYNVMEELIISNDDNSYMIDNDLAKPIYSVYIEYEDDEDGNRRVKKIHDYIPYINNSEPIVQQNGKELIYGERYTFINPETNDGVACSFLMLKQQPKVDDIYTLLFNSNKTNILIVGYDNLNIENRFGLVYLSELKYPLSPEYMNVIVNGEKLLPSDMDILSDKLVRFHHIHRPITSILITTNSIYKDIELEDYLSLYKESEFEKLVEEIFHNCDPSKKFDANYPIIDYVYKVDPYYSDFVGDEEHDYTNPYYKEYVDYIKKNKYKFDKNSIWSLERPEPDEDNEEQHEAWINAEKFFNVYKSNHGFVEDVDIVKQRENPKADEKITYESDVLLVMYLNWLARSGKTRTHAFQDANIDPIVLKYFSVYQNTIIDDRIDIVVDSNKIYDGLQDDINEIIRIDWSDGDPKPIYQYPGSRIDLRRRYFWNMFLTVMEEKYDREPEKEILYASNHVSEDDNIVEAMVNHKMSNYLYPRDFPLEPDRNGIIWTGSNNDTISTPEGIKIVKGE